jgi:hypothetical protein
MVQHAVARATEAQQREHATRIAEYERVGEIMEREPERFLQMLQEANPAYARLVGRPSYGPSSPDDPRPAPDARLSDGTPAYSPEGFHRFQEWQARQIEQRVLGRVSEKYAWVDQAKAARDAEAAARPKVQALLQDALENWDGFKDNQDAILKELRADTERAVRSGGRPRLSLHDAYRIVMNRTIKAERESWQKERETLRAGRSSEPEQSVPVRPVGARDSKDIIRESIARLRR